MTLIISHPTGNEFVRALVSSLGEAGLLDEFDTTFASFPGDFWDRIGDWKFLAEIRRRRFDPRFKAQTRTHPWRELGRIAATRAGISSVTRHEVGSFCLDAVYRSLDRAVASRLAQAVSRGVKGVYCYEDGAHASFAEAKKLNVRRFYDLPIAYWETGRRLMAEERDRMPAWAETLQGGILDSEEKLARKTAELELADAIICPSKFVVDSLPTWARAKQVVMAPFGSPAITLARPSQPPGSGRFRALFAGSMSQRKGLGDLFAAIKLLQRADVELVVMGAPQAGWDFYRGQLAEFTYEKGRPHSEVLALMRSCDALILPSIVEGRALVMQEAMTQGLPIVITPNTGGEDLIENGQTGFLVPIRRPDLIAEKISWMADHRGETREMGRAAVAKAKAYTWREYGKIICAAVAG